MALLASPEKKMKNAVIFGAASAAAVEAAGWLAENGWNVKRISAEMIKGQAEWPADQAAGQDAESNALDLLVISMDPPHDLQDGPVGSGHDYDKISERISGEIGAADLAVEHFLPALEKGEGKRIAFLTDPCASIRRCADREDFAYHMTLAGLHMYAKVLYNRLRPEGYTMRLYAVQEGGAEKPPICAGEYFAMNLCYDPQEPYIHSEENRFVMRDGWFEEIAW